MLKDIIEVLPQENYQLYLKFEDGKDGIIDISSVVELTGVFAPLLIGCFENSNYYSKEFRTYPGKLRNRVSRRKVDLRKS